jgi:2,5-diketo-D-gluconate reductase A
MRTLLQLAMLVTTHALAPPVVPGVVLKNAADTGMVFPATGLGTGCAIGGCNVAAPQPDASLNMSKQWLRIGGRRFDGADSYGIEPGIGLAIQQSGLQRSEVFIVSKTGPGGLAWPLGYNETIAQAEQIVANYSTGYVDLLLIHWPTNYGPCSYHGPTPSIPTTDPACDTSLRSYSATGCRLSTWRALVVVWKRGLAKAIGVSNFVSPAEHVVV